MNIPNTSSPSVVVSGPVITEAYGGLIFGWRPPSSCYGYGSKTPQQVDASTVAAQQCGRSNQFLILLAGAAVLGMAVRKKK